MHSGSDLSDDFLLEKGFCFSFFWFGNCCVDLVPMLPLIPSHVMQVKEKASEPFPAGPSEPMFSEVFHLDELPRLGSQAFE